MPAFDKKITNKRAYNTKSRTLQSLLFDYESDRGRIINSAAVRRLQQKTQVFPLERNAAVRSRLTHSLEVQQTGRFIVQTIFNMLKQQDLLQSSGLDGYERHIESLVEMSCLMHDIGNPPFGHFGEQAINDWFNTNIDKLYQFQQLSLKKDICGFEGNAQAIRIIHTLLQLNLTYTQVAGVMKYTRCGTSDKPTKTHPQSYLQKKVGYYLSEQAYINELCANLHIETGCRHPLSYIMEAADDISYCLADLEDAVEKDILSIEQLVTALNEEFALTLDAFALTNDQAIDMKRFTQQALDSISKDTISASSQFFIYMRVKCIHPLVRHAAKRFIENLNGCYDGSFNEALLEDKSHAHALSETFKKVAVKHAFCHKEVEAMELQGYRIISGLLDCYKPILSLTRSSFEDVQNMRKNAPLIASRMFKKLPTKHVKAYQKAVTDSTSDDMEFYYRCRLIQDNISGMTDQFAHDEYKHLFVCN